VLSKEQKKNQLKKRNRKKDKSYKKKCAILTLHLAVMSTDFKKLLKLIGACVWSETNAKSLLRS